MTLVSKSSSLGLLKKIYKKIDSWNLEKKFVKLASKDIIFEVLEAERGSSQFFYDGFVIPE